MKLDHTIPGFIKRPKRNTRYSQSLEFEEEYVAALKMHRARSFRADLMHKINVCRRFMGSREKTAEFIGVSSWTLRYWQSDERRPDRHTQELLDNAYFFAVEALSLEVKQKSLTVQRDTAQTG